MHVYRPLQAHLSRLPNAIWVAKFADVEQVLGRRLPASARAHRAWWSNQTGAGHSQARAWREAGWRTGSVDLQAQRVEFRRDQPHGQRERETQVDELLVEAGQLTGITNREALIREALLALVARDHAKSLIALGGSMPDFEPAARRRDA